MAKRNPLASYHLAEKLNDCGHAGPHGTDQQGKTHCYACCAERDRARMIETGRATLYLVDSQASTGRAWSIQNWPGSLVIPAGHVRKSTSYGFGRSFPRLDVWFTGPDGKQWYGVNKGDNQILRCKRLKA